MNTLTQNTMETQINKQNVKNVLTTLRRIPNDTFLALGTEDFYMGSPYYCLCGNAVKQELLALVGHEYTYSDADLKCMELFGGDYQEWKNIFSGVCFSSTEQFDQWGYAYPILPEIELAFVQRLNEIVR